MMIKILLRRLFHTFKRLEDWAEQGNPHTTHNEPKIAVASGIETTKPVLPLVSLESVWNYIQPKENTQANHLIATIGFEEWVEMAEIKRRVKEVFAMDYKNDRSLYPYVKTLADCGLFEFSDIGGKRKWKKKAIFVKNYPQAKETETVVAKKTG